MKNFKELAKSPEYWLEKIQNDFFRLASEYMEKKDLNQTELAQELKVSKGYVSQILNGDINFSLKKLIDLSLAMGAAPELDFKSIDSYIKEEDTKLSAAKHLSSGAFHVSAPMKVFINPKRPEAPGLRSQGSLTLSLKESA